MAHQHQQAAIPSWDAAEWIREFEASKSVKGGTRPVRAKVFQSTVDIVRCGCYLTPRGNKTELARLWNDDALRSNAFCEQEVSLRAPVHREYDTLVSVVEQDCLACARQLLSEDATDDVCVLNMASRRTPGGGVYCGAGAQEEYLFRCTDYFRFLYQYASDFDSEECYGIPRNPRHCYPLNSNFGGIFSRGVTVFRDTEANGYALLEEPWRVNFVAVAANNLGRSGLHQIPLHLVPSTLNQIRTILRIAYNNGQRRLVLGAFGCGAFGNPPAHMARLFQQVLGETEFQGLFRVVRFAIIEDHNSRGRNFRAFSDVLDQQPSPLGSTPQTADSISQLLLATGRKGVERVVERLRNSDFYSAPASVVNHDNFPGGLALHSLRVCGIALQRYTALLHQNSQLLTPNSSLLTPNSSLPAPLPFAGDSVVLCSLLHDVCKMGERTFGPDGRPRHSPDFVKNGPHGTKSVQMLRDWGLELTDEEALAISWHMGQFTRDVEGDYHDVARRSLLVKIIHEADGQDAHDDQ